MIDITGKIGSLHPTAGLAEWPMYSYDRPAYILWNAIAQELHQKKWSEDRIKEWLQSKETRWALDEQLGEAIAAIGKAYAETLTKGT